MADAWYAWYHFFPQNWFCDVRKGNDSRIVMLQHAKHSPTFQSQLFGFIEREGNVMLMPEKSHKIENHTSLFQKFLAQNNSALSRKRWQELPITKRQNSKRKCASNHMRPNPRISRIPDDNCFLFRRFSKELDDSAELCLIFYRTYAADYRLLGFPPPACLQRFGIAAD